MPLNEHTKIQGQALVQSPPTRIPSGSSRQGKFSIFEIYTTAVAAFSFLCIGLLRAYTSPAIASMKQSSPNILNGTGWLSEKEAVSWIASSPPLASFIGTLFSGPLLQYWGRQKTLLVHTFPYIGGWLLIGLAWNVEMILGGRILTGFAAGISTASAQLYVSECVRMEIRGSLGFLPAMLLSFGVLLGFSASTINVEWWELALIMGSLPTLLFVLLLTLPESPTWLLIKGREEEALKSLSLLRKNVEKSEIMQEFEALKGSTAGDSRGRRGSIAKTISSRMSNFSRLLRTRGVWLPTLIGQSLMFFQMFSGANVVIFFLSIILTKAEPSFSTVHVLDHNVGSVIVALVQFLAFFLSLPLIDNLGRKVLLLCSATLMSLSMSVLGIYFYSKDDAGYEAFVLATYSWLPITSLCCFIAAYSIGFGPVPFILMSEIFPSHIRSYLCSLTSFFNHFFLFIVIKMYPILVDWIGECWTIWGFALCSGLSIIMVCTIVPETKGKTMMEIEQGFSDQKRKDGRDVEGRRGKPLLHK